MRDLKVSITIAVPAWLRSKLIRKADAKGYKLSRFACDLLEVAVDSVELAPKGKEK